MPAYWELAVVAIWSLLASPTQAFHYLDAVEVHREGDTAAYWELIVVAIWSVLAFPTRAFRYLDAAKVH
jgi:hypothetical protein